MLLDPAIVEKVRQSLILAVENGYSPVGMTDEEVAEDMIAYDAEFEGWNVERLRLYVSEVHNNLHGTMQ